MQPLPDKMVTNKLHGDGSTWSALCGVIAVQYSIFMKYNHWVNKISCRSRRFEANLYKIIWRDATPDWNLIRHWLTHRGRYAWKLMLDAPPDFVRSLRPSLTHYWGRDIIAAIFQTTFSNTFSYMKMNEFWQKNSLKFVPKGPINNTTALVQIKAWRRPGNKLFSEPIIVRLPTHICVTRPPWVNHIVWSQVFRQHFQFHFLAYCGISGLSLIETLKMNCSESFFTQGNEFEKVCKVMVIVSWPQCVKILNAVPGPGVILGCSRRNRMWFTVS